MRVWIFQAIYEEHIWEIEHGSFTPLVFSCFGSSYEAFDNHCVAIIIL